MPSTLKARGKQVADVAHHPRVVGHAELQHDLVETGGFRHIGDELGQRLGVLFGHRFSPLAQPIISELAAPGGTIG
jgi:hypothetical protein